MSRSLEIVPYLETDEFKALYQSTVTRLETLYPASKNYLGIVNPSQFGEILDQDLSQLSQLNTLIYLGVQNFAKILHKLSEEEIVRNAHHSGLFGELRLVKEQLNSVVSKLNRINTSLEKTSIPSDLVKISDLNTALESIRQTYSPPIDIATQSHTNEIKNLISEVNSKLTVINPQVNYLGEIDKKIDQLLIKAPDLSIIPKNLDDKFKRLEDLILNKSIETSNLNNSQKIIDFWLLYSTKIDQIKDQLGFLIKDPNTGNVASTSTVSKAIPTYSHTFPYKSIPSIIPTSDDEYHVE